MLSVIKNGHILFRFGGPRGGRPYGPPPPRGDPRDFDRFPFPPLPPLYDRYDRLYHYYMEREREEYLAARLGGAGRDRLPPPRDLVDRFASDPRDRLPPSRQFMEERRGLGPDPFFRERDPIAARPPPEYYDRLDFLFYYSTHYFDNFFFCWSLM